MKLTLSIIALVAAAPALAQDSRQLDAHEHGVGVLDIAIEGTTVAMEFHAPGADIVGFEYAAESEADLAAVDAAVSTLSAPLDLFVMPDAASCSVTEAQTELEGAEDHDEHNHDDEDHVEEEHEDHVDEKHEEHGEKATHNEFHAAYTLNCDYPNELTEITFAYFEKFPNALEVEVQLITTSGAQAFEVESNAPVLRLDR